MPKRSARTRRRVSMSSSDSDNPLPHKRPRNADNSSDQIVEPEDDDDIPYIHSNSRSTTPLSDVSDSIDGLAQGQQLRGPSPTIDQDSAQIMRESPATTMLNPPPHERQTTNPPAAQEIIDVDEDLQEYYVISEDEENKDDDDDDAKVSQQRTVAEQLLDTSRQETSSLKNAHCAVCFDSPESTYILPCGHIYCGDCVFKALSSTKQSTKSGGPCSLCRAYTPYKKATPAIFKKKKKVLV